MSILYDIHNAVLPTVILKKVAIFCMKNSQNIALYVPIFVPKLNQIHHMVDQ